MARPPSRGRFRDLVLHGLLAGLGKAAANTMAEAALRFTQAATASRTPRRRRVKTARSTPSGSSCGRLQHRRPSIGSALRPTRWMSPLENCSA